MVLPYNNLCTSFLTIRAERALNFCIQYLFNDTNFEIILEYFLLFQKIAT